MTENNSNNAPQHWLVKLLAVPIAIVLVAIIEPTKLLWRKTYKNSDGNLNMLIGALSAIAGGVGIGYQLGSVNGLPVGYWLTSAVAATAGVFFYIWPLLYTTLIHHGFKLSQKLWQHVNIDGESNDPNPSWFSRFLIFMSWAAIVVSAFVGCGETFTFVSAQAPLHDGLLTALGVVTLVVGGLVTLVAGIWIAGESKGIAVFLAVVIGLGLAILGVPIERIMHLDPLIWRYWAGAVAGFTFAALDVILLGFCIFKPMKLRLLAAIFGGYAVHALVPATQTAIAGVDLGTINSAKPLITALAYGLEFFIAVGFVAPITHIAITHIFRKLADLPRWIWEVYGSRDSLAKLVLSLSNIVGTALCAYGFYTTFAPSVLGLSSPIAIAASTAGATLVVYTLGGLLLQAFGLLPLSLALSPLVAGLVCGGQFFDSIYPTLVAAAFVGAVFPLTFKALDHWLPAALVAYLQTRMARLHTWVCDKLDDFIHQIKDAAENTYNDDSSFRDTFLHLANVGIAFGAGYLTARATHYVGFADWLAFSATTLAAVLSYTFIGHYLSESKRGNGWVGFISAVVGGLFAGSLIHGAQPYGYFVSVPGAVIAAVLVAYLVFPIAYLLIRFVAELCYHEIWAKKCLSAAHKSVYRFFSTFTTEVVRYYRIVRDEAVAIKNSVMVTYDQILAEVRRILGR